MYRLCELGTIGSVGLGLNVGCVSLDHLAVSARLKCSCVGLDL
jgi:hypothetical protein